MFVKIVWTLLIITLQIKKQLSFVIQEEYSPTDTNSFFNKRIDQLQSTFKCCGIIGASDWANSKYNGITGIYQ